MTTLRVGPALTERNILVCKCSIHSPSNELFKCTFLIDSQSNSDENLFTLVSITLLLLR